MRKLNLVMMVVLTLGVIAGAAYLSMGGPPPDDDEGKRVEYLLRKLGDLDPELRGEAEAAFRAMGAEALPILKEAAGTDDARVARRARKLVGELEPAPFVREASPETKPEAPETPETAAGNVRFVIECPEPEVRTLQEARFYVRLVNEGPVPVFLVKFGADGYNRIGGFEIVDAEEKVAWATCEFPAILHPIVTKPQLLEVSPGATFDLFAGQADGRAGLFAAASPSGKGPYRIRFFYDAGEESGYTKAVKGAAGGSPLPPERLYSNPVVVRVAD